MPDYSVILAVPAAGLVTGPAGLAELVQLLNTGPVTTWAAVQDGPELRVQVAAGYCCHVHIVEVLGDMLGAALARVGYPPGALAVRAAVVPWATGAGVN